MEKYSFMANGMERKQMAQIISKVTGSPVKYAGPPSFAYETGAYHIDRNAKITSPVDHTLQQVMSTLKEKGVTTQGDGAISIAMENHSGASLRNLVNLISSKESLLQKSLDRTKGIIPTDTVTHLNSVRLETVRDYIEAMAGTDSGDIQFDFESETINLCFFNATLEYEEMKAHLELSKALIEQAKKLRYTSYLQKEVDNEKYAFRCFLLRLGFIGDDLKTERKWLLSKLTGDGSFKSKITNEMEVSSC